MNWDLKELLKCAPESIQKNWLAWMGWVVTLFLFILIYIVIYRLDFNLSITTKLIFIIIALLILCYPLRSLIKSAKINSNDRLINYPSITGQWQSIYQQKLDPRKTSFIWCPSSLNITSQDKDRFTGSATFVESDGQVRIWRIDGLFHETDHPMGHYISEDRKRSFGNFIVSLAPDLQTADGSWSGFDMDLKMITVGRYKWARNRPKEWASYFDSRDHVQKLLESGFNLNMVEIDEIDEDNLDDIVKISDSVFGSKFLNKQIIQNYVIKSKLDYIQNSFIAKYENQIIGFAISFAPGKWEINNSICSRDKWPEGSNKASYFATIAVIPELQALGVGSKLFEKLKANAIEQGSNFAVGHVWLDNPNSASLKFVLHHGAILTTLCENYWFESSEKEGWDCSRCVNPCRCSAGEFVIPFKGKIMCKVT